MARLSDSLGRLFGRRERRRRKRSGRRIRDVFASLAHARELGFAPRTVFDCGAFVGAWTRRVAEIFPEARFVCIEPNPEVLDRTREGLAPLGARAMLLEAALGEAPGHAHLNVWDPAQYPHYASADAAYGASSLLAHVQGEPSRRIPCRVRTLDEIARAHGATPDLVKLDLQGAELAALRGGGAVLAAAEMFVVEFGLLGAYRGRTNPRDLLDCLYDHGHRLYDVVDLGYRAHDGALAGGDFVFVRATSPLLAHEDFY